MSYELKGNGQSGAATDDQAAAMRQWYAWIGEELSRGQTPQAVAADMATRGWTREQAGPLVAGVYQQMQPATQPGPRGGVPPRAQARGAQPAHQLSYANRNAAARQEAMRRAGASHHGRNMLVGGLWCVGGIVITALTYSAASNGGGRYVVAWGAIVFGGIQFLKGLFGFMSNS